ncbi:MAG: ferrous iron transport protein A [Actinomycetota bacterium]|jgi:Fe2+ transport system protein FeoA|nr:ferrous iron transport protein A [Actinomycetota bacterium]
MFASTRRYGRRKGIGAAIASRTLDTVRSGDEFEVGDIDDDAARVHAIRFGMGSGSSCSCVTRIPAGPIVLRSGRQEIAVGRKLAQRIAVKDVRRADAVGRASTYALSSSSKVR